MAQTAADFFNFPTVDIAVFLRRVQEEFEDDLRMQNEFDKELAEVKKGDPSLSDEMAQLKVEAKLGKRRIPYPMLMLGKAGIGKTQGIRELCERRGWGYKEMRLVNFTETDLIGIPYRDENNMTQYATNGLLPTVERDGATGIILVDEFTSAPSNIQVPILQLTDSSRSIGSYHLPDGWKIVLAGNGPGDGGTFRSLPGTVISRASCYYVETSTAAWLQYAGTHGIHRTIRAYIGSQTKQSNGLGVLHGYEESDDSMEKAFPCPRTWEKLSRFLHDLDKRYNGWEISLNREKLGIGDYVPFLVASCIGVTAGTSFLAFTENEGKLVDPEAICKANTPEARASLTRLDNLDAGAKFLTICTLADFLAAKSNEPDVLDILNGLIDKNFIQMYANALNWVFESVRNYAGEDAMFAVTEINQRCNNIASELTKRPEFKQLCPKYDDVIAKTRIMLMS